MEGSGVIGRLLARLSRPAHIGWGGDYRADWTFTTLWEPNPRGEIR